MIEFTLLFATVRVCLLISGCLNKSADTGCVLAAMARAYEDKAVIAKMFASAGIPFHCLRYKHPFKNCFNTDMDEVELKTFVVGESSL